MVLSILELTSLDDTNSRICPVRHLVTYLRASKGRRKPHSGDYVFIQNELTLVVITLHETVVIVNPEVGVITDLISSMDHQVIFHQVATIPSLQTVPTTVFKRTRSKLTSRWTFVPPQTSLERIRSSKLLSSSRKWIKSSSTSKLLVDAKPNSDFNSRGPKLDYITKEVQNLLLDDIIQQVLPNRYSKCIFNSNAFTVPKPGTTLPLPRLLHGKTRYQERLPPHVCRSTIHKLIPLRGNDSHYRWKTMPFGLSTAPRIFTMLLDPDTAFEKERIVLRRSNELVDEQVYKDVTIISNVPHDQVTTQVPPISTVQPILTNTIQKKKTNKN
ncbi:hypothetical protein ACTFIW_000961 [Dictyostelium discoideum]